MATNAKHLTENQMANLHCLAVLENANHRTHNPCSANMGSLISRGLVSVVMGIRTAPGAGRKRLFGLTAAGRQVLLEWLGGRKEHEQSNQEPT